MHQTRFIIAGMKRSGTTLLHSALTGHPDVKGVRGEVIGLKVISHGPDLFTFNRVRTLGIDPVSLTRSNLEYLFSLFDDRPQAVGFKTAFHLPELARSFLQAVKEADPGIKVITTVRKDCLATAASMMLAQKLKRFHTVGNQKTKDIRVRIDPVVFSRDVIRFRDMIDVFEGTIERGNHLGLTYEEDLARGVEQCYAKVCQFLNLEPVDPSWVKMKKQARHPSEFVSNYERLREIEEQTIKSGIAVPETIAYRIYRKVKWLTCGKWFQRDKRESH